MFRGAVGAQSLARSIDVGAREQRMPLVVVGNEGLYAEVQAAVFPKERIAVRRCVGVDQTAGRLNAAELADHLDVAGGVVAELLLGCSVDADHRNVKPPFEIIHDYSTPEDWRRVPIEQLGVGLVGERARDGDSAAGEALVLAARAGGRGW